MRKFLLPLFLPLCFAACTGSTTSSSAPAGNDSAAAATVTLPYTATYSSNFVPGKQADVLTVLNSYKAWETNDMKGLRATFADSVLIAFPDGSEANSTGDSLTKMASTYRDSLSSVRLTIYAWTSNHSVDKNEDWVNVWYKEVDTHKTGKVDSVAYEDDNLLKNGKIAYISSHSQKFKKK
jgi:hypothetical protein